MLHNSVLILGTGGVGLSAVQEGDLRLRGLVTTYNNLADFNEALDDLSVGRGVRSLVAPIPLEVSSA